MQKCNHNSVALLWQLVCCYRLQVVTLIVLGFVGGILDGFGVGTIIPILSLFLTSSGSSSDFITRTIKPVFSLLSIPFTLRYLFILIAVFFMLRALVLAVFSYISARISAEYLEREMKETLTTVLGAKWLFLLGKKSGYLQNTLTEDVRKSASIIGGVSQVIQSFSAFIIYLFIAFKVYPLVTLFTLIAGGSLILLISPLMKKTQAINKRASLVDKEISHYLNEHIGGVKIIKASGQESNAIDRGVRYFHSLADLFVKNVVLQSVGTIFMQPFTFVFIVVVFGFAYKMPGFNLAVFAATIYLIQKIFAYLQSTQGALHSIFELLPYLENLFIFKNDARLHGEESSIGGKKFICEREIAFKNVSFGYTEKDIILSDISFSIQKGETVGLIGPSGAGKTSIADLLLRLFRVQNGQIVVDGINNADSFELQSWRDRIGYVSQDSFLLHDSVAFNIRFYNTTLSQTDIENAARKAHIYDFVANLPLGFDTIIGDRGIMLSGGQRQRVLLARALVKNPELLILDEATSALDNESELLIQKAINEMHGRVTVFIIAHRLSTVMNVDKLLVLRDGKIEEEGRPQDLLCNENSYFYRVNKSYY